VTPTSGGVVSSSSDTVTVNTNNAAGYNLTLADSDTNTNLVSGGNNIAAHSGTFAPPTTLGNNTWGYRIVGAGGFGAQRIQVKPTKPPAPQPGQVFLRARVRPRSRRRAVRHQMIPLPSGMA
jgi:hypothetical protein